MAKKDVRDFVCKPFCSFYREGKNEELMCNGARVLEILVNRGLLSPGKLSAVKAGTCFAGGNNAGLERTVCMKCPFRPDGCDFRSESPPPDAEPCGGYVLLDLLAACGVITGNDLEFADEG